MTQSLPRDLARPEFVALIAAIMSLNALAIDVMLPALPYMGEALGVTDENHRQYVVLFYMLGFGIGQLIVGPRGVAAGEVELKNRKTGERETLPIAAAISRLGGAA